VWYVGHGLCMHVYMHVHTVWCAVMWCDVYFMCAVVYAYVYNRCVCVAVCGSLWIL
jgi:hypothetical protein